MLHGLFSGCGELVPLSSCSAQASHFGGFSCWGAQALGCAGSVVEARGLWSTGSIVAAHRLSCMWEFPGSGIEPMCLALAGEFFTTREALCYTCFYHSKKMNELDCKRVVSKVYAG